MEYNAGSPSQTHDSLTTLSIPLLTTHLKNRQAMNDKIHHGGCERHYGVSVSRSYNHSNTTTELESVSIARAVRFKKGDFQKDQLSITAKQCRFAMLASTICKCNNK